MESEDNIWDYNAITERYVENCGRKLGATEVEVGRIFRIPPNTTREMCIYQCVLQNWNVITMNGDFNQHEALDYLCRKYDDEAIGQHSETVERCKQLADAMTDLQRMLCESSVKIYNCLVNDEYDVTTEIVDIQNPDTYSKDSNEVKDQFFEEPNRLKHVLAGFELVEYLAFISSQRLEMVE